MEDTFTNNKFHFKCFSPLSPHAKRSALYKYLRAMKTAPPKRSVWQWQLSQRHKYAYVNMSAIRATKGVIKKREWEKVGGGKMANNATIRRNCHAKLSYGWLNREIFAICTVLEGARAR